MNRKKTSALVRVIALVLVGLMVLGVLISGIFGALAETEEPVAEYTVCAEVLTGQQVIGCEQTTVYHNVTDGKLSQLFFTCYPNVLRRVDTLPFDDTELADAYPEGFAPGGIQFTRVLVDGEPAEWGMRGADETVLRVAVALRPGESCTVEMTYQILLPACRGFMGAGSFDIRLTDAFPQVCPVRDGEFLVNGCLPDGVFACAEASGWRIEVTAPREYLAAVSGAETREDTEDDRVRVTASVTGGRDCALVLSRRWSEYTAVTGKGTQLRALCTDPQAADALLGYAVNALDVYEENYGASPYGQIDLVMSDCPSGGKSAPGLILLSRDLFTLGSRAELEYTVMRLLAQQWFGGLAGVDMYTDPWLCESLSCTAALLALEEISSPERMRKEIAERVTPSLNMTVPGGATPAGSAAYLNGRAEYDTVLRGRGTAALLMLRSVMGEEAFDAALAAYPKNAAGTIACAEDFIAACDAQGGSWSAFLADVLYTIGADNAQTEWIQ